MRLRATSTALLTLTLLAGCKNPGDHLPFRMFKVVGASMEPTVYERDTIYVDQSCYKDNQIADGDLVVFHHSNDTVIIKRVSAVAGETIEGRNGTIYRNSVALNEPYIKRLPDEAIPQETFSARKIAPGQLFVTGDFRDRSLDSRADEYGPVLTTDVIGRVKSVYSSTHPGQTGRTF